MKSRFLDGITRRATAGVIGLCIFELPVEAALRGPTLAEEAKAMLVKIENTPKHDDSHEDNYVPRAREVRTIIMNAATTRGEVYEFSASDMLKEASSS